MPRPRAFDEDEVVEKAMRLFWRRGYAGTAMSDIYAETGLRPGSLYGAFADKDGLFRRAFEAYAARFRATLPKGVAGLAAIEAWLATQVRLAAEDPDRAGCLIVNTVAERDVHPPATQALARGRLQEIRDFFVAALTEAVAMGEVPEGLSVATHADALVGAVVAIMTLGRAGADRTSLEHIAEAALAALRRVQPRREGR
ncbi:TetR/AcrR family transcriptional regulator [Elioraea rosea]|uniref:TetR/AcrR family transcriptional regulator n=1 Tax=Elioraea rosea TaxID=2492390 RepID=UPI001185BC8D|nr:TetR/AcrR family transcriptional regulator [Elioraea rosea]